MKVTVPFEIDIDSVPRIGHLIKFLDDTESANWYEVVNALRYCMIVFWNEAPEDACRELAEEDDLLRLVDKYRP